MFHDCREHVTEFTEICINSVKRKNLRKTFLIKKNKR